jgi:hypothetical protein
MGGWGIGDPNLFLYIVSIWVKRFSHAKFQLPRLPGSGGFMVGKQQKQYNLVELEASLAVAKADKIFKMSKKDKYQHSKVSGLLGFQNA